jgi:hypothetical protein
VVHHAAKTRSLLWHSDVNPRQLCDAILRRHTIAPCARAAVARGWAAVKVFLSWSGERSKAMAAALREWLPLVLHYAEPWMSQLDISAGGRWAAEVGRELEASNFGLICLTPENLAASWIAFEAGALSKTVEKSSVVPYLLDVDFANVEGPLAQFQSKKADKASTLDIVRAINAAAKIPVEPSRLGALFEMAWPQLSERLAEAQNLATDVQPQRRAQAAVLEDLVATIRGLDKRLEGLERGHFPRYDSTDSGFCTVDTAPLLGAKGRVLSLECHKYMPVGSFLDRLWILLADMAPEEGGAPVANTYGEAWALRARSTGKLFVKMGRSWARKAGDFSDDRTLVEVGISPGMVLEAVSLVGWPQDIPTPARLVPNA